MTRSRSGPVKVRQATAEERVKYGINEWQRNLQADRKKKPVRSYHDFQEDYRQMEKWARDGFVSRGDMG